MSSTTAPAKNETGIAAKALADSTATEKTESVLRYVNAPRVRWRCKGESTVS